jgi:type IV pilus assembly protein PilP
LDEDETRLPRRPRRAAPAATPAKGELTRMKGHLRASRWVGIALLASALVACGGSQGDLEKWVAEVKARPAPALPPLPVMQQFETFEYDAQNLRDPFSELFNGGEGGGPRPDAGRRKQTLEQFPLDSLDMVGTLGTGRNLVALLWRPTR